MKRLLFAISLLLLILAGCTTFSLESTPTLPPTAAPTKSPTIEPTDTPTPKPTMVPQCVSWGEDTAGKSQLGWWNETVFYEIFVRSFYDSDGDGIGDFNGIVQKLDYLNDGNPETNQDLGITGIWLMPINPSPSYHGYDVSDYYDVNPEYGTMADFKTLLEKAHQRGIRVIIDMVLNHTSSQHPWFHSASTDPDSPYRDYYTLEEKPQSFDSPWGTKVWHLTDTGFYYGIFGPHMPDLDYTNPEVTAEMQEVIRFWLEEVGVDGFRLDAVKHLIEEGSIQENTLSTHNWWEGFYDFYTSVNPDAFTVGEAWSTTSEVVKYIGDEVTIAFEFDTAAAMLNSARGESKIKIQQAHQNVISNFPPHQYATFLTNHDQGRVMSELSNDSGQASTAASLLLTGPGVPFLFYGEEIGQNGRKPDENIRSPMQWTAEKYAGFTTAELPWRRPQQDFEERNVATQMDDPDSLLSHYRNLIQLRNKTQALQTGSFLELPTSDRRIYAFLRSAENQILLVIINLSRSPIQDYRFCLADGPLTGDSAKDILKQVNIEAPVINSSGGFESYQPLTVLDPYSIYIIELK
jgi:glycosidase